MRSLARWSVGLLALACGDRSRYACSDDAECVADGVAGVCEPSGYCSFPDATCPFGRRYGELAPRGLAGECVSPSAGSGGVDGDGSGVVDTADSGADGGGCVDASACDDDNPCSIDACEQGVCTHAPRADDPSCACAVPSDCVLLPPDDDCRTRTCVEQVCDQVLSPAGTAVNPTLQTPRDCRRVECDGLGGTRVVDDNADTPTDASECTVDACIDGTPSNAALPRGSACMAGTCDASGACTGCTDPSECGGESSACATVTCDAGVCGVMNVAAGVALPADVQTSGDCQERRCDGRGAIVDAIDGDDEPADDGNVCTDEVCNGGVAGHPAALIGTACPGGQCNGAGACVECLDDADCPSNAPCMVGACEGGSCQIVPAMVGTSCSDGQFCNGAETCNAMGNCVSPGNPCPGPDGDSDCSEVCNEMTDMCTGNDPSGSECGDCRTCNASGSCVYHCGGGQTCCAGDDICISMGAMCP
ncbi:MAG: hypothetical protein IPH07_31340 [Deltaproteobacteria bacterium]|nr:hypothetical protein [Deltaproteobacteria bacterium]MBK8234667.1 hypothetical protein [Deltaproteobacteria bacterium]MBK8715410.1 hypothetical protein [Deltaproteobacteria bacterium]MBP7287703.1 hypothetical protein [Nannocystaceae bacterium]